MSRSKWSRFTRNLGQVRSPDNGGKVQGLHCLLYDIGADGLASLGIAQGHGVEADIVDLARDALTGLGNKCQRICCEGHVPTVAGHLKPMTDVADCLGFAQGLQAA